MKMSKNGDESEEEIDVEIPECYTIIDKEEMQWLDSGNIANLRQVPLRTRLFGFDWAVTGEVVAATENYVNFTVSCNSECNSNIWQLDAVLHVECLDNDRKLHTKRVNHTFKKERCSVKLVKLLKINKRFGITVQRFKIGVQIIEIVGRQPRKEYNFSEKYPILSDAIIHLPENNTIHVNRAVLSLYSPVFLREFQRLEKANLPATINLKEDYNHFLNLMNLIYPSHELPPIWFDKDLVNCEVPNLLRLASKYNIEYAIRKCEDFLINTTKIPMFEKLFLAQKYKLNALMNRVLVEECKNYRVTLLAIKKRKIGILDVKTKSALFDRILEIMP